jgi:hypothetical protein
MPLLSIHPKQCSCCHIETHRAPFCAPWKRAFVDIFSFWSRKVAAGSPYTAAKSRASQRYTPASSSIPGSIASDYQPASGGKPHPLSKNNSNIPANLQIQQLPVDPMTSTDDSKRILFAVQGPRWSLEVEQIHVTGLLNDPIFFRELRKRYKKHRSWPKRLMSPFRFRFCRFVKVRTLPHSHSLMHYEFN